MNRYIPFIICCFGIFLIPFVGITIFPAEYLGSIPSEERWVIIPFIALWFLNWIFLYGFVMVLGEELKEK